MLSAPQGGLISPDRLSWAPEKAIVVTRCSWQEVRLSSSPGASPSSPVSAYDLIYLQRGGVYSLPSRVIFHILYFPPPFETIYPLQSGLFTLHPPPLRKFIIQPEVRRSFKCLQRTAPRGEEKQRLPGAAVCSAGPGSV